jgi:hypothetical protein
LLCCCCSPSWCLYMHFSWTINMVHNLPSNNPTYPLHRRKPDEKVHLPWYWTQLLLLQRRYWPSTNIWHYAYYVDSARDEHDTLWVMISKCYTMSIPHQVVDSYGVMGMTEPCHDMRGQGLQPSSNYFILFYSSMRYRKHLYDAWVAWHELLLYFSSMIKTWEESLLPYNKTHWMRLKHCKAPNGRRTACCCAYHITKFTEGPTQLHSRRLHYC